MIQLQYQLSFLSYILLIMNIDVMNFKTVAHKVAWMDSSRLLEDCSIFRRRCCSESANSCMRHSFSDLYECFRTGPSKISAPSEIVEKSLIILRVFIISWKLFIIACRVKSLKNAFYLTESHRWIYAPERRNSYRNFGNFAFSIYSCSYFVCRR